MTSLNRFARRFAADRSGATAIEYGLIVALIFVCIVITVQSRAQGQASS